MKIKKTKILLIVVLIIMALIFSIIAIKIFNKEKEIKTISYPEEQILNSVEEDEEILILVEDEMGNELDINEEEIVIENNDTKSVNNQEKKESTKTKSNYFIKVNYQANTVTIYKKDEKEEYTPIKAMICSTGTWTPKSGTYNISNRFTWGLLRGDVWGQYCTRITGSILFHSVPYTAKDKSALEYWEYDKLGSSASLGCVRLTVIDAKWIYDNIPKATPVEFYADSNPGPLGKPSARKISSESDEYRNWDPTDPDSNNPWRNWKEREVVIEENKTNENLENNNVYQEIDIPKDSTIKEEIQDNSNGENNENNKEELEQENVKKDEILDEKDNNENEDNLNSDNTNNNNQNKEENKENVDLDNSTHNKEENDIKEEDIKIPSNEKLENDETLTLPQS